MRAYLFKVDDKTEDCKFMKASMCVHMSLGYAVMEQYILEDSFDYKEVVRKNLSITRRNYRNNKSLEEVLKSVKQKNKVANIKDLSGVTLVCTRIKDKKEVNQYIIICCTEFKWSKNMSALGFNLIKQVKGNSFSFKQYIDKGNLEKAEIKLKKGKNSLEIEIEREDNQYKYQVIKDINGRKRLYEFTIFDSASDEVYEI